MSGAYCKRDKKIVCHLHYLLLRNNMCKYIPNIVINCDKFLYVLIELHEHKLDTWPIGHFTLFYIWVSVHYKSIIYRVSQEERTKLRESVPYVKLYRYNPKHLYTKLNGYGDNGQRSLKLWQLLHTYWLANTY